MPESTDWKQFFDAHAPHYLENAFATHSDPEVDFLMELLALRPGDTLLDVGCGVGRHAIRLAQRGLRVTGVDISEGMLAEARRAGEKAGVEVEWIQADATTWQSDILYDAAICLCEGGVGLANSGEDPIAHDLAMLRTISNSLRPNGMFVMTAMNGYAIIRQMTDDHVKGGRFNPATMMAEYVDDWQLPEGKRTMKIRERLFIPPEMVALLRHVGFEVLHVWGGTAGDWGRRPVKLDEVEAMYVCRKV